MWISNGSICLRLYAADRVHGKCWSEGGDENAPVVALCGAREAPRNTELEFDGGLVSLLSLLK